jgi:hypothetical protein
VSRQILLIIFNTRGKKMSELLIDANGALLRASDYITDAIEFYSMERSTREKKFNNDPLVYDLGIIVSRLESIRDQLTKLPKDHFKLNQEIREYCGVNKNRFDD